MNKKNFYGSFFHVAVSVFKKTFFQSVFFILENKKHFFFKSFVFYQFFFKIPLICIYIFYSEKDFINDSGELLV